MPNSNQLEQLEAELMSVLTMLQTISSQVLIASMRINAIVAAADYDERAAAEAKALITATADELGIDKETTQEKEERVNKAIKLARATEADHQLTAAQKKGVLEEAKKLTLSQDQLEAFDVVTRMVHLDKNIKMAYAKAAAIEDQDKIAADDLEPFWSQLSQRCLSKSGMSNEQLITLRSMAERLIKYSVIGTQGEHVLSRLEGVLMSKDNKIHEMQSLASSKVQAVMSALEKLPADQNEQKKVLPFILINSQIHSQIQKLEQRLFVQEG